MFSNARIFKIKCFIGLFLFFLGINFFIYFFLKIDFIQAESPPEKIVFAARSLWNSGSLQAPEYLKLAEKVSSSAKSQNLFYWQDAFSLSKEGKLYPKHSLITIVFSAPFYGLFGDVGFLIFQTLIISMLFYVIQDYFVVRFGKDKIFFSLLITGLFTQTLIAMNSYYFGYDLHGALLILLGYVLSNNFPFLGNFIYPLSLFVRPSHILLFPFLFFAQENIKNRDFLYNALIGLSMGTGLYMICNYYLWGSPFLTAYHRIPYFDNDGQMYITDHPKGLELTALRADFFNKLFNLKYGIVVANSCFLFLPIVVWRIRYSNHKQELIFLLLGVIFYILYVFSYPYYETEGFGNRFVLPVIYLYLLCLGRVVFELNQKCKHDE